MMRKSELSLCLQVFIYIASLKLRGWTGNKPHSFHIIQTSPPGQSHLQDKMLAFTLSSLDHEKKKKSFINEGAITSVKCHITHR